MAQDKKINVVISAKDMASKTLAKLQKSFKTLALVGIGAATAAVAGFAVMLKKSVHAASVQQDAVNKLTASMRNNGTYTKEARDRALEYAAALQKQTTYGDEAIIAAQAQLNSLAQLSGDGLDRATKATLDLAAATGMDLNAASQLVGKSLGSSTNALSRYGVQVNGAVGSQERLNSLVDNAARLFGGAAAAQAETYSGKVQQLKNAWGDFLEQVGNVLIPVMTTEVIPALQKGVDWLSKFLTVDRVSAWVKNFKVGLGSLSLSLTYVKVGALAIGDAFQGTIKSIEIGIARLKKDAKNTWSFIKNGGQKNIAERQENHIEYLKSVSEIDKKHAQDTISTQEEIALAEQKLQSIKAEANKQYADSVAESNEKIKDSQSDTASTVNDITTKLAESQEKATEQKVLSEIEAADTVDAVYKGLGKSLFQTFKDRLMAELLAEQFAAIGKIGTSIATHIASLNFAGAAVAAAQLAVPAAQVAAANSAINALTPKFETGGVVPGTSYTGDKVVARLNSGEEVLTADDPRHINNMGGRSMVAEVHIHNIMDGKQVAKSVTTHQLRFKRTKEF